MLQDTNGFPVLFDVKELKKKDLFIGTFMRSTELSGAYQVLSYLNPSELSHSKLKHLLFFQPKSHRNQMTLEFHSNYTKPFEGWNSYLKNLTNDDVLLVLFSVKFHQHGTGQTT